MSFSFPQLYKNHHHTIFFLFFFFGVNFFKSSEADAHPGGHSQAFFFASFKYVIQY